MVDADALRLLVIADAHVAISPRDVSAVKPGRNGGFGLELLRRAIDDAAKRGGFDAIALMGDVLNDGDSPDAAGTLQAVRDELARAAGEVPLLIAPGNHDGDVDRLLATLGARIGGHDIAGYRFYVFRDSYREGKICTRPDADRQAFLDWAARGGGPIVVLQHNPMHPVIEDDYPFMLTNREAVMADYTRAGVSLSLSGHYHVGQPLNEAGGVRYFTAPSLCEEDHAYSLVTLHGPDVRVETRTLRMPAEPPLIDGHAHTEFAYCGRGVTADSVIERSRRLGLAGVRLVEHAPQLYVSRDDFWVGRHVREPAVWRRAADSRAEAFRAAMEPKRDGFVRIGLEVELDADGHLTLHDDDRWVDLLVGAIHFLQTDPKELSDAALARAFMQTCEGLVAGGIDVLAHPWRIFAWAKRRVPRDLYGPLAELLRSAGVAAEINFHENQPDPDFFARCIERGVKIALGSDAHELRETASFGPHMDVLRRAAGTSNPAVLRSCLARL